MRRTSGADHDIERPLERYSAFGKLSYDFSKATTLYMQGLYARTDTQSSIGFSLTQFLTATVSASDPFIPASLRQVLDSRPDPDAPFQINKRFVEVPVRSALLTGAAIALAGAMSYLVLVRAPLPRDEDAGPIVVAEAGV